MELHKWICRKAKGWHHFDRVWRIKVQNCCANTKERNPKFQFNFAKYIKRYNLIKPDIVSLLFGANEFQHCSYDNLNEEIEKYICSIKKIVASIKEFDRDIKIIINLKNYILSMDLINHIIKLGI